MSTIQKFFTAILPRSLVEAMKRDSQAWKICCCTCGSRKSIWDVGGIRYKAFSKGKFTISHCSKCGCLRRSEVRFEKD